MDKPRVLVVDDDPPIIRLLQVRLEQAGFAVDVAAGGEEALDKVAVDPPAVILLDVSMPDLSGFDVVERLKAQEETAAIPIFLLTGQGQATDRERGERLGVDLYLTKPFSPRKVLEEIKTRIG
jgi:DNA-binding response OmpR family regulator